MTDWNQRLRDKIAGMSSAITKTRAIYAGQLGRWIDRYHGGGPAGLDVAHIYYETAGNTENVGSETLGEYGAMSITSSFPPTIGMSAESRYDPETNVFLGCMELQINAIRLANKIPEVELGNADSWKLAHLSFVIGYGGVNTQVTAARAAGYLRKGHVYGGLCDWVKARGGVGLQAGSQEPAKVGYRILVVQVRWDVGQAVVPGGYGMPRLPPQPPKGPYQIPFGLEPYFHLAGGSSILPVVALALAGAYLLRRMTR